MAKKRKKRETESLSMAVGVGRVINWYQIYRPDDLALYLDFFRDFKLSPAVNPEDDDDMDRLASMAMEWLVFDYRFPGGKTMLQEYVSDNPEELGSEELSYLKDMEETHFVADFLVTDADSDSGRIDLIDLHDRQNYQVFELLLSSVLAGQSGIISARLARVANQWLMPSGVISYQPADGSSLYDFIVMTNMTARRSFRTMVKDRYGLGIDDIL